MQGTVDTECLERLGLPECGDYYTEQVYTHNPIISLTGTIVARMENRYFIIIIFIVIYVQGTVPVQCVGSQGSDSDVDSYHVRKSVLSVKHGRGGEQASRQNYLYIIPIYTIFYKHKYVMLCIHFIEDMGSRHSCSPLEDRHPNVSQYSRPKHDL